MMIFAKSINIDFACKGEDNMKKIVVTIFILLLLFSACSEDSELYSTTTTISNSNENIYSTTEPPVTKSTTINSSLFEPIFPSLTPEKDSQYIVIKTYKQREGKITISYPEIKNLNRNINEKIQKTAMYLLNPENYAESDAVSRLVVHLDCEVKYFDLKYVSIVFWGRYYLESKEIKDVIDGREFQALNAVSIDYISGKTLELKDVINFNSEFNSIATEEIRKVFPVDIFESLYEVENNLELIHANSMFYLSKNALVISASIGYGFPFEIPYEKLNGLMKIKVG